MCVCVCRARGECIESKCIIVAVPIAAMFKLNTQLTAYKIEEDGCVERVEYTNTSRRKFNGKRRADWQAALQRRIAKRHALCCCCTFILLSIHRKYRMHRYQWSDNGFNRMQKLSFSIWHLRTGAHTKQVICIDSAVNCAARTNKTTASTNPLCSCVQHNNKMNKNVYRCITGTAVCGKISLRTQIICRLFRRCLALT